MGNVVIVDIRLPVFLEKARLDSLIKKTVMPFSGKLYKKNIAL